jgi:subtilase family serine protease
MNVVVSDVRWLDRLAAWALIQGFRRAPESQESEMLRANLGKVCAVGALLSLSLSSAFAETASSAPTIDFPTRLRSSPVGSAIIPDSGVQKPGRRRTHIQILVPPAGFAPAKPGAEGAKPAISGGPVNFYPNTPASLACIYGLVAPSQNCNPTLVSAVSTKGSGAIAIVDAYHYPTAMTDANVAAYYFGLPQLNSMSFRQVWAGPSQPPVDPTGGWEIEGALDIQMVHAMAPNATIFYVEAQSDSSSDLFAAVDLATWILANFYGGGQVTMSWGGPEGSATLINQLEAHFTPPATPNYVNYFASTGDTGDTSGFTGSPSAGYPALSPQVVAVGGTSTVFDQNLNFVGPKTWQSGGMGVSQFSQRPAFQNSVQGVVGNYRGVPDVSAIANPYTGVFVYSNYAGGFLVVGGTSAASPLVAALFNAENWRFKNTNELLTLLYTYAPFQEAFLDITNGFCGPYEYYNATAGYDLCTGLGTPR